MGTSLVSSLSTLRRPLTTMMLRLGSAACLVAVICSTIHGGNSCGTPSAITDSEEVAILLSLNQYRASDPMSWDADLAALAQQRADTCEDGVEAAPVDCSGAPVDQVVESSPASSFDAGFFAGYIRFSVEYNYPDGFQKWFTSYPGNFVYQTEIENV